MGSEQHSKRPRWQVALDTAVVATAPATLGTALLISCEQLLELQWALFAGCFAVGVLGADAVSGVIHWFGDNFLEEDTPVLGPLFIEPFREHHRDPQGITRHGLTELNGNNCLGVTLVCAWLSLGAWPGPVASGLILGLCSALAVTNQIHSWAHNTTRPRWVSRLQQLGLILSPSGHNKHHAAGGRGAYCITTGWANGPLDRAGVFEWIERMVKRTRRGSA